MFQKIFKLIKQNIIFIFICIIIILSFWIELPYYIQTGGGLIDTNDRINVNTDYNTYGSIHMAYVSEMKATPFSLLLAKIKNYTIEAINNQNSIVQTEKEISFRSHLLLKESNQNAILVAYQNANKEISVIKREYYVTYVDPNAKTDLKISDQILEINQVQIKNKNDFMQIINNGKIGDSLEINTQNGIKHANIISINGNNMIGIMITEQKELKMNPNIEIKFKESESGSSGGLMLALAIYNQLVSNDITNGLKLSGTGTIDEYGNVGEISGVKYKLKGAVDNNADIFFVPNGKNYEEALKEKETKHYDIEIVGINTFNEALDYLK